MGASEDRATLAEHERQRRASEVEEIMVPGYGIWTATGIKYVLDGAEDLRKGLERLTGRPKWLEGQ